VEHDEIRRFEAVIDGMGESALVLPSQLRHDGISEAIRVNPYLRLMLAVFNQELSDYAVHARNPKKYPFAHSAGRAWLSYTGPPQDLFSFESICMYFDWEPTWLAPKILKWMERIDGGWRPKMVNRSAPRPRNPMLAGRDRHSYNRRRKD
jgi:hypothetical protein